MRVSRVTKPKPKKRKQKAEEVRISLPSERSEPKDSFSDYVMLVYGERKIGKTTLCSAFPDTFFCMFEPGGRALRIFQRPMREWEEFVAYLDLLEKKDHDFSTVVVDTVDIAYDQCFDYMCRTLGINHPHEEDDYGQSWGQIEAEYKKQLARLMSLDLGVVFISHDSVSDIVSRTGRKYNRVEPSMKGQAQRFLTGVVDLWCYYTYFGKERYLIIRGSDFISAGCRLKENFVTPEGEPVVAIPMGDSEEEGYASLMKAFENKQKDPHREVLEDITIAKS